MKKKFHVRPMWRDKPKDTPKGKRKTTKAERDEIADYLARYPRPLQYID